MLGVLMLDTGFTRFPGDIGHAGSHEGPVMFSRVPRATVGRVIGEMASLVDPAARAEALAPFLQASEALVAQGATAITTSCGFLAAYQAELAAHVPVPVMTSALCLLPAIAETHGDGESVGVLTFDAAALTPSLFAAIGYTGPVRIAGLEPGGAFQRAIRETGGDDSFAAREGDVVTAARSLIRQGKSGSSGTLGAVVLECTNFPPHRAAIEAELAVPVFDIWDVVRALTGTGRARAV